MVDSARFNNSLSPVGERAKVRKSPLSPLGERARVRGTKI